MHRLCVVIPIYKEILTENENYSVMKYIEKLNHYDIYFICPFGLNTIFYHQHYPNVQYEYFSPCFFENNKSYNKLMLNVLFYKRFSPYDYILIAQTDAMIIGDEHVLEEMMEAEYDYTGAPWFEPLYSYPLSIKDKIKKLVISHPEQCLVGNGGFSLRKIESCIRLIEANSLYLKLLWHFNEDYFFSYRGMCEKYKFRIAPVGMAEKFALEQHMNILIEKGEIPFAVHAWEKYYSSYEELCMSVRKGIEKKN